MLFCRVKNMIFFVRLKEVGKPLDKVYRLKGGYAEKIYKI